ncbi:hypothetical protein D3C84_1165910 [compost metagenome]
MARGQVLGRTTNGTEELKTAKYKASSDIQNQLEFKLKGLYRLVLYGNSRMTILLLREAQTITGAGLEHAVARRRSTRPTLA